MDKSCCIANRASLTSADWFSRILRRTSRGGAELSQFEALIALIGSVQLSDSCDSWQWHPNYTVGYTVASARALVDESILEKDLVATRWNRNIPINVNIFLW
nr:RNA-directed DNA polymerase, eukaryota, reverse transcriptase zinc-binding domain protein [Tanacetum cinerariifolium]